MLIDMEKIALKLYILTQTINLGYDTYDSMIVCAETPKEAKDITIKKHYRESFSDWATFDDIKCEFIGVAGKEIKKGIILESFNAG